MKIAKNKFISVLLILIATIVVFIPSINAGVEVSRNTKISVDESSNKVTSDETTTSSPQSQETKATIGTFWWYRGDGGLIYAEGDAEGFVNTLTADGCALSKNRNSEDNELYDSYLQEGMNELIDSVDIAYYVGHSGKTALGIYKPFPLLIVPPFDYPEFVEAYNCKWGDDGPNKWVVLATCLAAHGGLGGFQNALDGTNMILGWDTQCSDAKYGPTFASKIIEGMTLKEAWFETAEECEHVHARAKILGEDISVGNDHLKGYGDYANPENDLLYHSWTHEVNGWQTNYYWIPPDGNNALWENGALAYDNHDPDYVEDPDYDSDTYAVFRQTRSSGWSDPLILTLNEPTQIRGFRILPNKYQNHNSVSHVEEPIFDQMKLSFYEVGNSQPVTTVVLNNWESGSWRIIDFEEGSPYQAQATISGNRQPTVIKVKIEIHENSPRLSFIAYPAKISEFDFWSTLLIPEELNIASQEYSQEFFESVASNIGMSGEIGYVDTASYPETYKMESCGKTLTYGTQTGILKYTNPSEKYATVLREPNLPNDIEAISAAKNLLVETGLPSDEIKETLITYDTQGCGEKETGNVLYEWITTKTIYFDRQINGITLPNKIAVTIGENGNIAAFSIPMETLEINK